MKRIFSLLSLLAIASFPSAATAQVLQVQPVRNRIQVTNISNREIYVQGFILQNQSVNTFGKPTGRAETFSVAIGTVLKPRQSVLGNSYGNRITANTQLVIWNDGEDTYQQGVRICFTNGYGRAVYMTRHGQAECPRFR
jgi:hypothetical protein